MIPVYVLIPSP